MNHSDSNRLPRGVKKFERDGWYQRAVARLTEGEGRTETGWVWVGIRRHRRPHGVIDAEGLVEFQWCSTTWARQYDTFEGQSDKRVVKQGSQVGIIVCIYQRREEKGDGARLKRKGGKKEVKSSCRWGGEGVCLIQQVIARRIRQRSSPSPLLQRTRAPKGNGFLGSLDERQKENIVSTFDSIGLPQCLISPSVCKSRGI